jgi:hypothetical protein
MLARQQADNRLKELCVDLVGRQLGSWTGRRRRRIGAIVDELGRTLPFGSWQPPGVVRLPGSVTTESPPDGLVNLQVAHSLLSGRRVALISLNVRRHTRSPLPAAAPSPGITPPARVRHPTPTGR